MCVKCEESVRMYVTSCPLPTLHHRVFIPIFACSRFSLRFTEIRMRHSGCYSLQQVIDIVPDIGVNLIVVVASSHVPDDPSRYRSTLLVEQKKHKKSSLAFPLILVLGVEPDFLRSHRTRPSIRCGTVFIVYHRQIAGRISSLWLCLLGIFFPPLTTFLGS